MTTTSKSLSLALRNLRLAEDHFYAASNPHGSQDAATESFRQLSKLIGTLRRHKEYGTAYAPQVRAALEDWLHADANRHAAPIQRV